MDLIFYIYLILILLMPTSRCSQLNTIDILLNSKLLATQQYNSLIFERHDCSVYACVTVIVSVSNYEFKQLSHDQQAIKCDKYWRSK